ncbi:MAG: P1 family peptidase [Solobacterium sp.]|nr:P1 family peptidase [Solobacterium sp.]
MKEIPVTEIEGFKIGNAEYPEGATGCTVILAEKKTICGNDVRGGAPASRENALLDPLASNDSVNAVILCGGSAFGLAAADGVMKYLEEKNIGFPTEYGVVPIVCASSIFDLGCKRADIRPDAKLGYEACINAETNSFREGSFGAGTGATVGKMLGAEKAMKSGLGIYAAQIGDLKAGAIAAVNALGDIYDHETGEKLAGVQGDLSSEDALVSLLAGRNMFMENTTIAAIITNAKLDKTALTKAAGMAHDGMARSIRPVHTMFDGDTIYVLGSQEVEADVNALGVLCAEVLSKAIERAAKPAGETYGFACAANV